MPFKKKINNLLENQKAEIERLRMSNDSLNEIIGDLLDDWSSAVEKAKSEAIKEFAEKVKERAFDDGKFVCTARIDNLVKEMTGVSENVC